MKKLHIEKSSLFLVRLNIFLWLMISSVLVIYENFSDTVTDIIHTDIVGVKLVETVVLTDVHMIMIFALIVTVPVVFLLNKFYVKVMKDSVEIEE